MAPPSSFGFVSRVIPKSKLVGFTRLLCFGSRGGGCSGVLGSLESGFAYGLAVRLRISGVSGAFSDVLVVLPLRVSFRSRAAVSVQKGCEPRWTAWDLSHPLASARALRFPRNICAVVPAFFVRAGAFPIWKAARNPTVDGPVLPRLCPGFMESAQPAMQQAVFFRQSEAAADSSMTVPRGRIQSAGC